jgi:hypothetical protein
MTYLVAALLVVLTVAIPVGTRTAQAVGLSTTCPPQLTLTPNQAPPQKRVYVCGSGFVASGSRVELQLYNPSKNQYQFLQYATPTNGDVIAHITIPIDPGGQYDVVAFQRSSGIQEQASFTIISGFQSLKPAKGSDVASVDPLCSQLGVESTPTSLSLQAWGLPASTPYTVDWLYTRTNSPNTTVASGNTTASGQLSTSFHIPAGPGGPYEVIVFTSGPGPTATFYSDTYSCFTYSEVQGSLDWNWDGVGWDANSTVDLNLAGGVYEQAIANEQGSIGGEFSKPCLPPGTYPGTITGTTDGGQAVSIPLNPPVTVDNNCECLPRCVSGGSSTTGRGVVEVRPVLKLSH